MNCSNCGGSLAAGATVCRKCGTAVPQAAPSADQAVPAPVNIVYQQMPPQAMAVQPPQKSKVAAGLLAIFLGSLGIHRFYLGYNGLGVLMLLITLLTCGWGAIITGIWALIEGIMILTGAINSDASGRPLRD